MDATISGEVLETREIITTMIDKLMKQPQLSSGIPAQVLLVQKKNLKAPAVQKII